MSHDEDINMDSELEDFLGVSDQEEQDGAEGFGGGGGGGGSGDDDEGAESEVEENEEEILSSEWSLYKGKFLGEFVELTKRSARLQEQHQGNPAALAQELLQGVNRIQAILQEITQYEALNWTEHATVHIPRRAVYEDLSYSGLIPVLLSCLEDWTFSEEIKKGDGDQTSPAEDLRSRTLAVFLELVSEPKIANHLTISVPAFKKFLTPGAGSEALENEQKSAISILVRMVTEKRPPCKRGQQPQQPERSPEIEWRKREIIVNQPLLPLLQDMLNNPEARPSLLLSIFDGVRDMCNKMMLGDLEEEPTFTQLAELLRTMDGLKGQNHELKASFFQTIMHVGSGALVEHPAEFITEKGLLELLKNCMSDEEDLMGIILPICSNFIIDANLDEIRLALDAGILDGISTLLQSTDMAPPLLSILLDALESVAANVPEELPVTLIPKLVPLASTQVYITQGVRNVMSAVLQVIQSIIDQPSNLSAVADNGGLDFLITVYMDSENKMDTEDLRDAARCIRTMLRLALSHGDQAQALTASLNRRLWDAGVFTRTDQLLTHEDDHLRRSAKKLKERLEKPV